MAGRPSLLTPEVHRSIVNAVIEGASLEDASLAAGAALSTVTQWRQRGEQILDGKTTAAKPVELECPTCHAGPGERCRAVRAPHNLINPHRSRNFAASDPEQHKRYADFAREMNNASSQGVVLDLRTIGQASRPHKVTRTTTKTEPLKMNGRVLMDELGLPVMATSITVTESEEVDWRAAAWRLARMRPDLFGDKVTTRIEGELEITDAERPDLGARRDDAFYHEVALALRDAEQLGDGVAQAEAYANTGGEGGNGDDVAEPPAG